VPLFTSGGFGLGLVSSGLGLGLVILVLVLRIWSCSHHFLLAHGLRKADEHAAYTPVTSRSMAHFTFTLPTYRAIVGWNKNNMGCTIA